MQRWRVLVWAVVLVIALGVPSLAAIRYEPTGLNVIGKNFLPGRTARMLHKQGEFQYGFQDGMDRDFYVVSTGPTRIIPYYTDDRGDYPLQSGSPRVVNFRAAYMRLVVTTPSTSLRIVKFGPAFAPADSAKNAFWISTETDSLPNAWTSKFAIDSLRVTIASGDGHVYATAW